MIESLISPRAEYLILAGTGCNITSNLVLLQCWDIAEALWLDHMLLRRHIFRRGTTSSFLRALDRTSFRSTYINEESHLHSLALA